VLEPHRRMLAALGRHRELVALGVAAWAALHFAVRAAGSVDAILAWVPFRCPLRWFTGVQCPTCGLGHALVEAVAGNFAESWQHHPAGVALLSAGLVAFLAPDLARSLVVRARTSRPLIFGCLVLYTLWGCTRSA